MRHAVARGKRIRPHLIDAVERACTPDAAPASDDALRLGVAVELVHKASLIQDDLPSMDAEITRDGEPTTHNAFSPGAAVLASDVMLARAFAVAASVRRGRDSVTDLALAISSMCVGQCLDLASTRDQDQAVWLEACDQKTGALFAACARLGLHAADVDGGMLRDRAELLGLCVGRVFQLLDDLADGDPCPSAESLIDQAIADYLGAAAAFPNP
ncbi:MAG: polyprenyl synthetase family protein, partial [Planctomycetota bacterium]